MQGMVRTCVRMKRGKGGVKRCAKYKPTRGRKSGTRGLSGEIRHCVRYQTASGGVKRCAKYSPPGGPPSARARKRAKISRPFFVKGGGSRVCAAFKNTSAGKRCKRYKKAS